MKYLVILGVIALIFYLLILWRMRRYFPVVRQIFGITRSLYRMTKGAEGASSVAATRQSEPDRLVRCNACGTWIPSGRALKLRGKSSVYCSTTCLESAASEPQATRRSAKG
ncbi:MAG TPA: hypothetical protein VJS44_03285 [Pyrinomonadaceae bacterium]|nr:hypothetical protein [Pyrinomonadaceae bacterium]